MITPFALYFYGVYGPILEFLSSQRLTAWTVEFFLPHMIFVSDPLLIAISYLQATFVIGLVLFAVAAIPLYFGRLTGKGVVSSGLYARIRHPQYLALAICGFGLMLYWCTLGSDQTNLIQPNVFTALSCTLGSDQTNLIQPNVFTALSEFI